MSLFEICDTEIPGCKKIIPTVRRDDRGSFIKTFHFKELEYSGINLDYREEYYSVSARNVIRGMHFQSPPMEHEKLVYCVHGKVLDVVLDLRKTSPTYGKYQTFALDQDSAHMVFIPRGCAHGFLSQMDNTVMMYKVTSMYSMEHDNGVLWNSFGFDWPVVEPYMSERDKNFIKFEDMPGVFI